MHICVKIINTVSQANLLITQFNNITGESGVVSQSPGGRGVGSGFAKVTDCTGGHKDC